MKREIMVLMALLCCLTGCGRNHRYDNPYRVDTVIQIPMNPTEAPAGPIPTTAPAEPEKATEETENTQEEPAASSEKASGSTSAGKKTNSGKSSGKTSGTDSGKTTSNKTSSNKANTGTNASDQAAASENETKATEPPAEKPAATQPPETVPAETKPAETAPPDTQPPATAASETEPLSYDPSGYRAGNLEYAVLDQINAYREKAGVAPLSMDENLCAVASVRAYEISILWSHTRPDGRSYKSVLSDYGYSSGNAAENLIHTSGSGDAAAMVAKWMSSEKNKEILLSDHFTVTGIGVYSAEGITYLANLLIG